LHHFEAVVLAGAGSQHEGEEVGGGRAGGGLGELGEGEGGDFDVEVDPVEEGAGDPAEVLFDLGGRAGAGAPGVGAVAAGTRVIFHWWPRCSVPGSGCPSFDFRSDFWENQPQRSLNRA